MVYKVPGRASKLKEISEYWMRQKREYQSWPSFHIINCFYFHWADPFSICDTSTSHFIKGEILIGEVTMTIQGTTGRLNNCLQNIFFFLSFSFISFFLTPLWLGRASDNSTIANANSNTKNETGKKCVPGLENTNMPCMFGEESMFGKLLGKVEGRGGRYFTCNSEVSITSVGKNRTGVFMILNTNSSTSVWKPWSNQAAESSRS